MLNQITMATYYCKGTLPVMITSPIELEKKEIQKKYIYRGLNIETHIII